MVERPITPREVPNWMEVYDEVWLYAVTMRILLWNARAQPNDRRIQQQFWDATVELTRTLGEALGERPPRPTPPASPVEQ